MEAPSASWPTTLALVPACLLAVAARLAWSEPTASPQAPAPPTLDVFVRADGCVLRVLRDGERERPLEPALGLASSFVPLGPGLSDRALARTARRLLGPLPVATVSLRGDDDVSWSALLAVGDMLLDAAERRELRILSVEVDTRPR
jgi:hypothetical protein